MRLSPWPLLFVCALVVAGCQRTDPAQPKMNKSSAGGDFIEATPMKPDEHLSAPETPAPVSKAELRPAPEEPTKAPGSDAGSGSTTLPEAWDMKPGEVQNCREAIGETASARLVQRCIQVSPATHPPCNAANPCALIQGEIDRSCAMYGPGETKPKECQF